MSLSEAEKKEVQDRMLAYATAYRKKDFSRMMELFSPTICGYGSGPDEIIHDHADFVSQIRRDMGQATITSVDFSDTKILGDCGIAWVMTRTAITFTAGGAPATTLNGRTTMVLRNMGGRWLIEQIHFSLPCGGQPAGQSFPTHPWPGT